MATIDNATGETVADTSDAPNVLRMPASEEKAERIKTRRVLRKPKGVAGVADVQRSAADMAASLPGDLSNSIDDFQYGVETAASAGLSIGKLLMIGLGVYLFLEVTADRRLKRYAGD